MSFLPYSWAKQSDTDGVAVTFEFCVKELLIHLHKNAVQNMVFCFTNARSTNYRPGDTLLAMRVLLNEANMDVASVLKKETVFCMDNEAFRYLAAIKHGGIGFSADDDKTYDTSWERSRGETDRMMNYISGLKPHKVKDTISINDVRRRILDLTKPLAEFARHIDTTIRAILDQKAEIEKSKKSSSQIYEMIKIQVPTLERRILDFPRTVCTSLDCCETHVINGQSVKKFNTHCHKKCYLDGVQADTVNNPDLKDCEAMLESGGDTCSVCGCSWNTHMHVTYKMVSVDKEGEDKSAKKRYQNITDRIELKVRALEDYERIVKEMKEEKREIIGASARFGDFLKANSAYNDAMISYLNLMIKVERDKAAEDSSALDRLCLLKQRYEEEIRMIKTATADQTEKTTAMDQDLVMKRLFKLKHFGKNMEAVLKEVEEEKYEKVAFEETRHEVKSGGMVATVKSVCVQFFYFVASKIRGNK